MTGNLLIDANNAAMRAVHAMSRSGLTSDRGVATGPLLAFVGTLSHHIREERPDKVAVCWDGGRSEYRLSLDPAYKAHRLAMDPEQEEAKESTFALCKEFCSVAGLFHVERQGVEADDLIAWYAAAGNGDKKQVILSSDKDFLMLLNDTPHEGSIEQVRLSSYDTPTDRWTARRIRNEMGCEPKDLVNAMALAGDISDNIPGVPRFGMKTAIKMLRKYDWDLEYLLHCEPKVAGYVERVRLNFALVNLRNSDFGMMKDLVLPELPMFHPTKPGDVLYQEMLSFLSRYQMKGIQNKLYDGTLWK